jgi:fibronectin type 3 domain-containing protein
MLWAQDSSWVQRSEYQAVDSLPKVVVLAQYNQEQVQLRFAIDRPSAWYANIPYGFKIERFETDARTGLANRSSRDTFIVKPRPLKEFEAFIQMPEDYKYHLTIAECLYGSLQSEGGVPTFGSTSKEIQNKHGLALFAADMNFEAALAGGLAWVDPLEVREGSSYFYRVNALMPDTTILPAYTSIEAIRIPQFTPQLAVCLEGEGKVTLQWERELHEPFCSAYWIERSEDSLQFERIHEIPFVGGQSKAFPSPYFSYTDRIPLYEPYYYRIRAITPFGKISPPSRAVRLMARDRTPCPAASELLITTDAVMNQVKITWEQEECPDVKGWQVYKGTAPELPFTPVGSLIPIGSDLFFREQVEDTRNRLYYKIQTIDSAGNTNFTLARLAAFRDTMPPAIPSGLYGQIDSAGTVHLKWSSNQEADLRGYHIFKANAADHIFTMVNAKPIADTVFRDSITLQTLTEEIYYRVSAVDFQGHISKYSEPLQLQKPDTMAPFPPSITHYGQTDDYIFFDWTPSRTQDVVRHQLYRKVNNGAWQELSIFNADETRFRDEDVAQDSVYAYKLMAQDDAGLFSVDHAAIRVVFKSKKLPDPPLLMNCFYNENNQIELSWSPMDQNGWEVLVYRSVNQGPFTVLDRLSGNEVRFIDRRPLRTADLRYALKVRDDRGKRSAFSNILQAENTKK